MLYVRYSACFAFQPGSSYADELLHSLATLEARVAAYLDITVVLYTLASYKPAYLLLFEQFGFASRVIALDQEYPAEYAHWNDIAASILHKSPVDHRCIVRMLADFHILPTDQHRLLLGCDIFFLDVPQELLSFVWNDPKSSRVLYMMDVSTFGGVPYRLRYYHPPILSGLLGDFYCLAPGVHLKEKAIAGCLRMIDDWPVDESRWEPPYKTDTPHACEQQAAAILLQHFPAEALHPTRYAHEQLYPGIAVLHTHNLFAVKRLLAPRLLERACSVGRPQALAAS